MESKALPAGPWQHLLYPATVALPRASCVRKGPLYSALSCPRWPLARVSHRSWWSLRVWPPCPPVLILSVHTLPWAVGAGLVHGRGSEEAAKGGRTGEGADAVLGLAGHQEDLLGTGTITQARSRHSVRSVEQLRVFPDRGTSPL